MKPSKIMGLIFLATACVSNQEKFSNTMEIDSTDGIGSLVEAQAQKGLSAKADGGYSLEWFSCTRNVKAPFVVMLNTKDAPFKSDTCKAGLVQAFLQQGYNVVAVNRPGYGQSEGKEVIGDDATLRSLQGLIKGQEETGKVIDGLWGFEDASVLAFRYAKESHLKLLVIGNGIYDWEATLQESKDPAFVSALKKLQADGESSSGGGKFAEQRSIAWDFSGLPKTVFLYHMKDDARFPASQAEAFRAALAANQYNVQLMELKDEKANLAPSVHQSVLMQIAELQKGKSGS